MLMVVSCLLACDFSSSFLLFTDSMLCNILDAVTVVLYHTVEGMNCILDEGGEITPAHYGIAFAKFIATSVGGIAIGAIFGALTSFLTKYTVETRGWCHVTLLLCERKLRAV